MPVDRLANTHPSCCRKSPRRLRWVPGAYSCDARARRFLDAIRYHPVFSTIAWVATRSGTRRGSGHASFNTAVVKPIAEPSGRKWAPKVVLKESDVAAG